MSDIVQPCYLVFRIHDEARFATLKHFFATLRSSASQRISSKDQQGEKEKTSEMRAVRPSDATVATRRLPFDKPENWLLGLRPIDMQALGLPPHMESINVLKRWRSMSARERRDAIQGDESLQNLADFADMLALFDGLEISFVGLERLDKDRARLDFTFPTFPYDHRGALEELLMFFGFFSILDAMC
ncbi:MAG: hypothetical protein NZ750_09950 [Anaerolineae bacterium]|nr:hypothetical protein [Anaerolineae bacterium]MDW8172604.1 hypothetical protein [Anaerolineae bacterium]